MFRCPHCRERSIGLWAKLKANGLRPSACPRCGGKYVPAVWTTLPILALLLGGLFGPILVAGSVPFPLLASLLVPGVLAASALYLATPLLRHGSSAARWEWWSFAGLIVLFALYALFAPSSEAAGTGSGEAASSFPTRPGSSSMTRPDSPSGPTS